jgi:hypothetical protein
MNWTTPTSSGDPVEDVDRVLVTLVPHTTSLRGSRFEVPVPIGFLRPGGFDAQSLVIVPVARRVPRLGRCDPQQRAASDLPPCKGCGTLSERERRALDCDTTVSTAPLPVLGDCSTLKDQGRISRPLVLPVGYAV